MAEKIPEDYTIARKYIRCVLRWFKAEIDYCLDCDRYFIRGQQKPDGEEVIFVVFGSRKAFTGAEFFEVRKCLPIEDDAPLALAIVDLLGVVTIFSLTSGIKEHIGLRSWKPGRPVPEINAAVDPQPGPSRSIKRGRKQVLTPKDELELRNIIVIDD